MLDVMGQLYLDGSLDKKDWQNYLKNLIAHEDIGEEIYTFAAAIICMCHLIELLPEVKRLFDELLIDGIFYGEYDSFVDMMFEYNKHNDGFCCSSVETAQLKYWAMFEQNEPKNPLSESDSSDMFDKLFDMENKAPASKPTRQHKISRNAPCPCGSGKKYKHCCLNKHKNEVSAMDVVYTVETIETEEERQKYLKHNPETVTDRIEGRIYLEDFFDTDSIEIDKLIYLALKHRPIPMWEQAPERTKTEDNRKKIYLLEAFSKFKEKCQKENIKSTEEYDKKYSIHYMCYEWLIEFMTLLDDCGEKEKYKEVMDYL